MRQGFCSGDNKDLDGPESGMALVKTIKSMASVGTRPDGFVPNLAAPREKMSCYEEI
jgi:hypothetical protein